MIELEEVILYSICPKLIKIKEEILPDSKIINKIRIDGEKNIILCNKDLSLKGTVDIINKTDKKFYIIVRKTNPLDEEIATRRAIGIHFILDCKYNGFLVKENKIEKIYIKTEEKYELLKWVIKYLEKEKNEELKGLFCKYCPLFDECFT